MISKIEKLGSTGNASTDSTGISSREQNLERCNSIPSLQGRSLFLWWLLVTTCSRFLSPQEGRFDTSCTSHGAISWKERSLCCEPVMKYFSFHMIYLKSIAVYVLNTSEYIYTKSLCSVLHIGVIKYLMYAPILSTSLMQCSFEGVMISHGLR
jgi:hypothetical protein